MKKIKILTITLLIALITMIAFFGVYIKKQNRMENILKTNSYAMDLKGARTVKFIVSDKTKTLIKDANGKEVENSENLTDEQIAEKGYTKEEVEYNPQDVKNIENYEKSKKIIKERLSKLGLSNYIIKLDEQTGDIILELTEDDVTDYIVSNVYTQGKFELIDTKTNEVLMDNNDIKTANVLYGANSTNTGTSVYLDIEFTKEGAKKLEEISNKYIKSDISNNTNSTENTTNTTTNTDNTNSSDTQNDNKTEQEKTITMKIDDQKIMSTSFEEPIKTGKLQLSVGAATTDQKSLNTYRDQAYSMAVVLDTGNLPITYEVEQNEYILSDITSNQLQIGIYIGIVILAIALIVLIIKYKKLGALGVISYIGLISIYSIEINTINANDIKKCTIILCNRY